MFASLAAVVLGLTVAPGDAAAAEPASLGAPATSEATMAGDTARTTTPIPPSQRGTATNKAQHHGTSWPSAPSSRGIPLFVLGGVATTTATVMHVFIAADALREAKHWGGLEAQLCEENDTCFSPAGGYIWFNLAPSVAFATGFGLLAGGMARLGRLDAWADTVGGRRATPWRARWRLGWGLFGGGLGLWAVTRIAGAACGGRDSELCPIAIWEAGYVGSLAMTGPGLAMIGYAAGYRRQRRALANLSVTPMFGGEVVGLTVTGRF